MICNSIHLKDRYPFLGENGRDPVLDVFLPYNMTEMNRQDQKRPSLLIVPGGGYGMVSQREAEPIALHFLPEGYNVFVLQYSVAPNRFPTQMVEVAAVMEMIWENAGLWHCDPARVAIMGFSAGGHLAAHYSNAYNCEAVRAYFPDSKPVSASVLCYPVITADPAFTHGGSFNNLVGHYPLSEQEDQIFSCEKLVTAQTPPTFIWHTAEDDAVPVNNSLLYAQALSRNGVSFSLHIYPYGPHGMATADRHTNDHIDKKAIQVKDWLVQLKRWLEEMV